jgi:hypothetical protein
MGQFLMGLGVVALLAATSSGQTVPAAGDANKFTIENCVNVFDRCKAVPTEVGYQY